MREYRKLNCEVQAFVADFELHDGDDTFAVQVDWSEWDGLGIVVRGIDGETLDGDEVARRFGFEHRHDLASALTEDVPTDCDYETLRPLNAGEVTR
jgi:hypothetical protein